MSFLARLFGTASDPKEAFRPLYLAIVKEARQPIWYQDCGAADTMDGRFDMLTNIMAMIMLRIENDPQLSPSSKRLTELLVDDLDGQLREMGIGDPTLGKKMGKMMEAMGGRIAAYRTALASGPEEMAAAIGRNVNLAEGAAPDAMASRLTEFSQKLAALSSEQLFQGEFSS